jgi:hypothetical protein
MMAPAAAPTMATTTKTPGMATKAKATKVPSSATHSGS